MRVIERSLKLMKSLERLNLSLIKMGETLQMLIQMEETLQMLRTHNVKDELGGH